MSKTARIYFWAMTGLLTTTLYFAALSLFAHGYAKVEFLMTGFFCGIFFGGILAGFDAAHHED